MIASSLMGPMVAQQSPIGAQKTGLSMPNFAQLMENPLFMAGIGLLGSNGNNGLQNAYLGLQSAAQTKDQRIGRERQEKEDKYKAGRRDRLSVLAKREDDEYFKKTDFEERLKNAKPEDRLSLLAENPQFAAQIAQADLGQKNKLDFLTQQFTHQKALQDDAQAHQINNPTMGGLQKDFQLMQSMTPEQREAFGVFKRGEHEPSSAYQTRLFEVNDNALNSRRSAGRYEQLADDFAKADIPSGVAGAWSEYYKKVTGTEDGDTLLRKEYINLRNDSAIQNLPPGVASDKDIEIVMSGFLPDNANPEAISSFMRGLAKLEGYKADYHEFEAEYLSQDTKRGPIGLNKAWRDYAAEKYKSLPQMDQQEQEAESITGQVKNWADL